MWILFLILFTSTVNADEIKKISDSQYEQSSVVKTVINLDDEKLALENEQEVLQKIVARYEDAIAQAEKRIDEHQARINAGLAAGLDFTKNDKVSAERIIN